MGRDHSIIEKLHQSLVTAIVLNAVLALALVAVVVAWQSGVVFPKFEMPQWMRRQGRPDPYAVDPQQVKLDSADRAFFRKMNLWRGSDADYAPPNDTGELIRYGRELIANTAHYLGPRGTVAQITNGMNCQNCHLDAGTRPWGNNYGAVRSTYPKFRERSGAVEDIYKRVSDCLERSLAGQTLPPDSREIRAMIAYIEWLGREVPKNETPGGTGIVALPYLARAADPVRGQKVYVEKCQSCHGPNGEGIAASDGGSFTYPPLWGANSYNIGAGLYRLSRFAGFVKYNMPFGATWDKPQLSDEECWDVAAFVNSQPHPEMDISKDWPRLAGKPPDHPFGPFADGLSEKQHKFGPWTKK